MHTAHDYESLAHIDFRRTRAELAEAYSGTSIVGWQGKIERQLVNLLTDAEKGRNYPYMDKLREFLKIWRANELTGSINRETLEILKSASDILAVDNWDLSAYFGSLRDQLRTLIASEEELPRGMEEPGNVPMPGGGGGGGAGMPPMKPDFGPEEKAPGAEAGGMPAGLGGEPAPEEGATPEGEIEGAPGEGQPPEEATPPGEPEAPGAEMGAPAPDETEGETPEPDEMPRRRLGTI